MKVWETAVCGIGALGIGVAFLLGVIWAIVALLRHLEVIG